MDALILLKADHEAVEEKFQRFEELGPAHSRPRPRWPPT